MKLRKAGDLYVDINWVGVTFLNQHSESYTDSIYHRVGSAKVTLTLFTAAVYRFSLFAAPMPPPRMIVLGIALVWYSKNPAPTGDAQQRAPRQGTREKRRAHDLSRSVS